MDGAVVVRERPGLLTPERRRQHDVGELAGLVEERVADDDEEALVREDRPDPAEVGQRDGGVRADDPEEADRALFRVPEDLHHVRGRRPARDLLGLDVPELRELADVRLVLPIADAGEVAVGSRLASVLRGRLAVHLEGGAAGLPDHPAQEVSVVHLDRRGRRLRRLVHALEAGRDQPLGRADDARRLADVLRVDAAELGRPLGRVLGHGLAKPLEADRVRLDELGVDPAVRDQLVLDRVEEDQIRATADRQVHRRLLRHLRPPGVDDDEPRRVGSRQPVEHARPEDGLRLGHVVADEEERVALVDVGDRSRVAVGAETFLERRVGSCRAEAGVAVEVGRPDSRPNDDREGVVVLEEELAGVVERHRQRPVLGQDVARAADDEVERGVPVGRLERAPAPDERCRQAIGRVVRLPAVEALRAETAVVDAVVLAVAHRDFRDVAKVRAYGRPGAVVFDVKGCLPRAEVDGRL